MPVRSGVGVPISPTATIGTHRRRLDRELDRLLDLKPTDVEGSHLRAAIAVTARVHLPRLHPHLGQVAGRQECGAADLSIGTRLGVPKRPADVAETSQVFADWLGDHSIPKDCS
jgi:hypothetical protein